MKIKKTVIAHRQNNLSCREVIGGVKKASSKQYAF